MAAAAILDLVGWAIIHGITHEASFVVRTSCYHVSILYRFCKKMEDIDRKSRFFATPFYIAASCENGCQYFALFLVTSEPVMGITLANLSLSGKLPVLEERLNKCSTGWNINGAISLIDFGPKPSGPGDFFIFKFSISLQSSFASNGSQNMLSFSGC